MTPAARLQAVIELIGELDGSRRPADRLLAEYFRARRYVGSGDRRAIREGLYRVLRQRARLTWLSGEDRPDARRLAALSVWLDQGGGDAVAGLFSGEGHAPAPLSDAERATIAGAGARDGAPDWVEGEVPPWLAPPLRDSLGNGFAAVLAASNLPAPVDLRVNLLKTDRDAAQAALEAAGLPAAPVAWSDTALRLPARAPARQTALFRDGLFEVQDVGSQIVADCVGAAPGDLVVDACAGAGGKTLALAARMANRGQIFALDTSAQRLDRLKARVQRAGVRNAQAHTLKRPGDGIEAELAGRADRVLIDAPCGGSGRWRRAPETKWQFGPDDLARAVAGQHDLLDRMARLVRPGGRLIYATCSLLRAENEDQVAAFLGREPAFRALPIAEVWPLADEEGLEAGATALRLDPHRHASDGFFAAVLERAGN